MFLVPDFQGFFDEFAAEKASRSTNGRFGA
jgi:hypothetical protein